jgi:hypothetical protein
MEGMKGRYMEKEIKTGREMTLERGISNRKKYKQTKGGKEYSRI